MTRVDVAPKHDSPFSDLPSPTDPGPSLTSTILGKHPAMLSTSPMDAADAAEAAAAAAATVYRLHVEFSGLRQEASGLDKVTGWPRFCTS